jgi:hypothetical protein
MGRLLMFALCLLLGTGDVAAQVSVYGIRGLGFPGRETNARTRALGGGFAVFDAGSMLNPAAVAGFGSITAQMVAETDFRGYTVDTVNAGGLSSTRFPLGQLGGAIPGTPVSFAVGYSQYSDRSYDLQGSDTIMLRGQPVGFDERTTSRGGVADLRGALGLRVGDRLRLGVAGHVLNGSAKLTLSGAFSDAAYRPYRTESEETVRGYGVSGGLVWAPTSRIGLGLAVRTDTKATVDVDSLRVGSVDLPLSFAGGVQVLPHRAVRWSTTVVWRDWSVANNDLGGARAFDTWEVGSGIELGGTGQSASRFPLRVGVRYATLPFSGSDQQPHELDIAVGVGASMASGRGLVDMALEHAARSGAGVTENAWQFLWTVTIRP